MKKGMLLQKKFRSIVKFVFRHFEIQRVLALRGFWDLEKSALPEIRVSIDCLEMKENDK